MLKAKQIKQKAVALLVGGAVLVSGSPSFAELTPTVEKPVTTLSSTITPATTELAAATKAVDYVDQNPSRNDYSTALGLVYKLPSSDAKVALMSRLSAIWEKVDLLPKLDYRQDTTLEDDETVETTIPAGHKHKFLNYN